MIDDSKKSQSQSSKQYQQPSQVIRNQSANKGKKKTTAPLGNQQSIDFFIKRLDKKTNAEEKTQSKPGSGVISASGCKKNISSISEFKQYSDWVADKDVQTKTKTDQGTKNPEEEEEDVRPVRSKVASRAKSVKSISKPQS